MFAAPSHGVFSPPSSPDTGPRTVDGDADADADRRMLHADACVPLLNALLKILLTSAPRYARSAIEQGAIQTLERHAAHPDERVREVAALTRTVLDAMARAAQT